MENATFKALYESKLREVYAQVYVSGALLETIDPYSTLIHTVHAQRKLVDITAYDAAVETLKSFITQRLAYLETLEVMQR